MGFKQFFIKALEANNLVFGDGISKRVQHGYRMVEMGQENQYQQEQQELRGNQNRELQLIMHELRLDFERAKRGMENSPFFHHDVDTADLLWQAFKEEGKPLFLISPFWDETKTHVAADGGGGDTHFRTAISGVWRDCEFVPYGTCLDGLFKRPLRQTDMDVRWIRNVLKDLPVILAYGYTDGKAVYPMLATWNVLPNTSRNQITSYHGKALLPSDHENEDFRQLIGQAMVGIAGAVMGITEGGGSLYQTTRKQLASLGMPAPAVMDKDFLSRISLNKTLESAGLDQRTIDLLKNVKEVL